MRSAGKPDSGNAKAKRLVETLVPTVATLCFGGDGAAQSLGLSAEQAFERGTEVANVSYDREAGGVALDMRRLIEDDGPGVRPYNVRDWYHLELPDTVTLEGDMQALKILHLDRPQVLDAVLVLHSQTANAEVSVNGDVLTEHSGRYRTIPPELLREGDNEILLRAGSRPARAVIASHWDILRNAPDRAGRPLRSFRSDDGGRRWEKVGGEYFVRMHLFQYAEKGHLVSPVIDLGGEGGGLTTPVTVEGFEVRADARTPDGTELLMQVRTGSTPVYDRSFWCDWQPAGEAVAEPGHRYLQWRAVMSSTDPLRTPVLEGVEVVPQVARALPDWAEGLSSGEVRNPELRYTSIPFVYENFSHSKLRELREKYELDEVVKGAKSEFEKMVLLRDWVRRNFSYDPPVREYPDWDAGEILRIGSGFCVQSAIALMQVYQSMGFTSRFVFGFHPGPDAGHEVTEVWSSEYDKWVLMDLPSSFHHVEPENHIPLSMMEIHERMVSVYYGDDKMITAANRPAEPLGTDRIITVTGTDIEPDPEVRRVRDLEPTRSPRWNRWANMRMMPRNDFYSRRFPTPYHQGFGWDWSEYFVWHTPQHPRSQFLRYSNITERRSDWEWTLNRVRFDVAPLPDEPGTVRVQMGTDTTPGFERYEVRTGDGEWRAESSSFVLGLDEGRTRIEMRVRNTAGVAGAVSYIELNYLP